MYTVKEKYFRSNKTESNQVHEGYSTGSMKNNIVTVMKNRSYKL